MSNPAVPPKDQNAVGVLIAAVASGASVTLASTVTSGLSAIQHRPGAFAAFFGLALVLQLVDVPVYGRGSVSFSGAGYLAIGFTFGVGAGVLATVAAVAVHIGRRRAKLHRGVFDAGQLALASAAGAVFYHALDPSGLPTAARFGPAIGAGLVYMSVNLGLLSAAMGLSEGRAPTAIWRERFRWMTPYFLASGALGLVLATAHHRLGVNGLIAFALPPVFMMVSIRQYLNRTEAAVEELRDANTELEERAELIQKRHVETIAALARSMEAKDHYTGGHTGRVADISVALAKRLGFEGEELDAIEVGAILHDIGKIGISEQILHKPEELDLAEWEVMRKHPVISDYILSGVDLHPFVRQIARSSHERVDGMGYPDKLEGEEIPLPARIVLVADTIDSITSDRPYRRARPLAAALAELREGAGQQFCARVVDALEQVHREQPQIFGTALRAVEVEVA